MILEAISNGLLMSLYCVIINVDYSLERLKSNESNVILSVHKEATQNIDTKDSKTLAGFNSHDGANAFC
jgi:hypothetical protein